jgi:hypothetical protein
MRRTARLAIACLVAAGVWTLPACGGSSSGVGVRDQAQGPLAAEDIPRALDRYLDRLVRRIDATATRIERDQPATAIRKRTLQLRIRAATMAQDVRHRQNALVALIEAWYWTTALDIHSGSENTREVYGAGIDTLLKTTAALRQEAEALAQRALDRAKFDAMRASIIKAVGSGDLFTPSADDRPEILDQFLSVTHLESILSLPLAPFTALNGIGRGADAVAELVKVADRGVDLAGIYPQLLSWQLQLILVDVEDRQITQQVVADLHAAAQSVASVAETAKELPTRVRQETVALLEQSQGAQTTAQRTLEDTQHAATALDGAARSLDQAVKSLDGFIASLKPDPAAPPQPKGEPFRIQDYTEAAHAIEGAVKQLDAAVGSLQQAATSPALTAQVKASADHLGETLQASIDHLAWRAMQVVAFAALSLAFALVAARRWSKR